MSRIPLPCDVRFFAALPGCTDGLVSLRERVLLAQHIVLAAAPDSEWSTDDERFAVSVLEPRDGALVLHTFELPLLFPMKKTGANGAKRELSIKASSHDSLVCSIESPYQDARGWGADTFPFHFDVHTSAWSRVVIGKDGDVVLAPLGDESEPARARVVDAPDVSALASGDPPRGARYASGFGLSWELNGKRSFDLVGFDAYLRGRPELVDLRIETTFAVSGGELVVDGAAHIAVVGRAFIVGAPFRDFLIVVPVQGEG